MVAVSIFFLYQAILELSAEKFAAGLIIALVATYVFTRGMELLRLSAAAKASLKTG